MMPFFFILICRIYSLNLRGKLYWYDDCKEGGSNDSSRPICQKIKRSRRYVFERKDFDGFTRYDQIGRALRQLVQRGELMKLGYGLHTKARINNLTGNPMPTNPGGPMPLCEKFLK